MEYIEKMLFDNTEKNLNILELGPCIKEGRENLIKYSFNNQHNYYCIDLINESYKMTLEEVTAIINKYNINAEFKCYNNLLKNTTEDYIKEFKLLKPNFFDIIFTKCSIGSTHMVGICKLSEIIGKKNCKCLFFPWLNTDSIEYYNNLIENLKLPNGYEIYDLEKYKKMTFLMKKNIMITKNIVPILIPLDPLIYEAEYQYNIKRDTNKLLKNKK